MARVASSGPAVGPPWSWALRLDGPSSAYLPVDRQPLSSAVLSWQQGRQLVKLAATSYFFFKKKQDIALETGNSQILSENLQTIFRQEIMGRG